jgi:hypothetical protein
MKVHSNIQGWVLSRPALTHFLLGVVVFATMLAVAAWWLGDAGMFAAVLAFPVLLIWAVIVAAMGIVAGWRLRASIGPAIVAAGLPLLAVLGAPIVFAAAYSTAGLGLDWGDLLLKRSSYETIIDAAGQGRLAPPNNTPPVQRSRSEFERYMWQTAGDGTRFAFERQSPHRLAFPFPGHFRHFYDGILFDPSGDQQRRADTSEAGQSTDLLMVRPDREADWTIDRCVHMIGHYYRCTFYP